MQIPVLMEEHVTTMVILFDVLVLQNGKEALATLVSA